MVIMYRVDALGAAAAAGLWHYRANAPIADAGTTHRFVARCASGTADGGRQIKGTIA